MTNEYIEQLFFNQIKNLTARTTTNANKSLDFQFSDRGYGNY